jgi:hypothetical protein
MGTVHWDSDFLVQRGRDYAFGTWLRMPFQIMRGTERLGVFHAKSFNDACLRYAEASSPRLLWDAENDAYTLDGVELTDGAELSQLGRLLSSGPTIGLGDTDDAPESWLFFQFSTAPHRS